jgi:hypothetical protein
MRAGNRSTNLILIVIALVAGALIWADRGASRVAAIQDSQGDITPAPRSCGGCALLDPFGLAVGQAARLTVLNSGEDRGIIIEWKFLDSQGNTLAQSEEPVRVPAEQMRSFDLDGDTLDRLRDPFGRVQMRAVVRALGGPDTRNLKVSIEVFDKASGRTTSTTAFCSNNL